MNPVKWKKPSPSMIVAMVALFIALSGGAYAGVTLNQVRSVHIKNGEVKTADLANNVVKRAKINNNAVNSAKVANGSLQAADLSAAAQIALKGNQGVQGIPGIPGAPGVVGAITVQRTDVPLADAATAPALATCPAGTRIIGGGTTILDSGSTDISVTVSRPFLTGAPNGLPESGQGFDSWRGVFVNPAGNTGATTARVFAICAQG